MLALIGRRSILAVITLFLISLIVFLGVEALPGDTATAYLGQMATDESLEWTGVTLREFGVDHVLGAHCTGINAVSYLRDSGNYSLKTAVVGTVGSTFTLGKGIQRGLLNR